MLAMWLKNPKANLKPGFFNLALYLYQRSNSYALMVLNILDSFNHSSSIWSYQVRKRKALIRS